MSDALGVAVLNYGSPVNWTAPLNRGLLSWWLALPQRMGGRRWFDMAGQAHGTVTGLPSSATAGWGPTSRPGGLGEVRANTSGSGAYVDAGPFTPLLNCQKFTIAAWIKRRTTTSEMMISQGNTAVTLGNDFTGIEAWSDNTLYFNVSRGAPSTGTVANSSAAWQHCVLVFDGSQATNATRLVAYLNGRALSLSFSGTIPTLTATGNENLFFGREFNSQYGNGSVDDVRIWLRPLAATDVRQLYQASLLGYPTELNWQTIPLDWAWKTQVGRVTKNTRSFMLGMQHGMERFLRIGRPPLN